MALRAPLIVNLRSPLVPFVTCTVPVFNRYLPLIRVTCLPLVTPCQGTMGRVERRPRHSVIVQRRTTARMRRECLRYFHVLFACSSFTNKPSGNRSYLPYWRRLAFFFVSPRHFNFVNYQTETSKRFKCVRETFRLNCSRIV